MRRAFSAAIVSASLLAAVSSLPGGASAGTAQAPPNVVVVMTDDQTVPDMRVMSRTRALIGDQGASFENAFVNYPLCCPSRATLLTGQYAHNHTVVTGSGFADLESSNTLPVWLQAARYRTAHVGKYLNGYGAPNQGGRMHVPPGWSEWYATLPDDQAVYDYDLNENGAVVHHGAAEADFKGDVITDRALGFIRRSAGSAPFFLSVGYTAPHGVGPEPDGGQACRSGAKPAPRHVGAFADAPLPRPPSFNEADVSDKPPDVRSKPPLGSAATAHAAHRYRCRLAALLHVDEAVAEMVDALRAAGELDRTLIIFTSDNGFFQGEHRIQAGKIYPYDEATQVPLLMRGPGVPVGGRVDALASNADLAPTILDAAGAQAGLRPDGISLFELIDNPDRERELMLESRVDEGQYSPYDGLVTPRYLYVEHAGGERELYDRTRDRYQLESRDQDPVHAKARRWLAGRLAQLRRCEAESCRDSASDPGAPETRITRRPKRRLDANVPPSGVRFAFRASEPSTFECQLDRRRWRPCRSPARYQVRAGSHRFRTRSTDVAGDRDATPARWRWLIE